jgi:hypothetical protein
MAASSVRAPTLTSERARALEGLAKVLLEFVIGEFSCLISTPDQVFTRVGLGVEAIDECPQAPSDPVADNRVADLSTDRVGHGDRRVVRRRSDVTDSK